MWTLRKTLCGLGCVAALLGAASSTPVWAGLGFAPSSETPIEAKSPQLQGQLAAVTESAVGRARVRTDIQPEAEFGFDRSYYELTAPVRVGIQTTNSRLFTDEILTQTRLQLLKQFGTRNVVFETIETTEIGDALQSGRLDFVFIEASAFSRHETMGRLKPIASVWPLRAVDPTESVGSVYFTRHDRKDIETPDDLMNRHIAATAADSFDGYLIAQRDMLQRGYVPDVVLSNTTFYGKDPKKVIQAVQSGAQDAGILPACMLETLAHTEGFDVSSLKMIGARKEGLLQCSYSTELYPLAYFAATPETDPVLTKVVSAGLFTMEPMKDGTEWSLPASNRAIHDLFFDLKIGPYEHLGRWNLERFVRDQATTLIGLCFGALLVIAYAVSLSILVRRRTKMLYKALKERDHIEGMAKASRDHIANLERTGIVGQMSTMIAHELKQPLGAITNFANGMLRRVKRGKIDEATLTQVLEEIVEQGTRASEIVNRVRAYAKHQTPELKVEDMSLSIEKAIETFKRSRRTSSEISTIIPPYLWAEIDGWELELAVLNLLKNAADSLEGVEDARIEVYVHPEDRFWRIEVSDNGNPITQEEVDKFMQPLVTSKANGLGLGLSIVANIVERHHGHFNGVANADRGVTIMMDIPRTEHDPSTPAEEDDETTTA